MKKLMFAAAVAFCGTVFGLESANVVGYQNKEMATANFNYECATFQAVGKARDAQTLGDIKASEGFSYSEIQFLTSGGANAYVDHPQLGRVIQSYTYWSDPDWTESGVAGWYLYDDEDGAYPMNDIVIPLGQAYCVSVAGSEVGETLNYAGEVPNSAVALTFDHANFNYVGNCTPADITLGDIVASEDFSYSEIQFLTSGGANAYVDHPQLGRVIQSYTYWSDPDWTEAGVAGWYLYDDEDGAYPMNDINIKAGQGFCVSVAGSEVGEGISIPSAL